MVCKTVTFSTVHIREFCLSVGDNPFVSSGPPIRLGSRKVGEQIESLDKFELLKRYRPVKNAKALMISKAERVDSLLAAGYSARIILEATSEALEAKRLIEESKRDELRSSRSFGIRRMFKAISERKQKSGVSLPFTKSRRFPMVRSTSSTSFESSSSQSR